MAVIVRYIKPERAAAGLGVPILPLLFNEALLALGNRVSLHALNTKRDEDSLHDRRLVVCRVVCCSALWIPKHELAVLWSAGRVGGG